MANISGSTKEVIYTVQKFLGLHESPDGDTKLKAGEAAIMRNFRVTRAGNLQRRPGYHRMFAGNIKALWSGYVGETEYLIAATATELYQTTDAATWTKIGDFSNCVSMFGYDAKVWFLNGSDYKYWDGSTFANVTGYVPLIMVSCNASGIGDTLEQVNKLTTSRRVQYSPDGSATAFTLPETAASVSAVTLNGSAATYTFSGNTVTLSSAPAQGVNTLEVEYTVSISDASKVKGMKYSELYNGSQDTRVFLYGDGSNQAIYSGLDSTGQPRADYFPDLNVVNVGTSNTPITGMIRQYSKLICFKLDSAWAIQYGTIALEDESVVAAFYTTPTNRSIGNLAPGQVRLVLNAPYTLFGSDIYEWRNNSSYSANLSNDERQAKRISDRIHSSLTEFDIANCVCWDDNDGQEYYVVSGSKAVVYNYAADAWYTYTNFPATCFANYKGELYFGTATGVQHLSENWLNDNGTGIEAMWESGSIAFNQDYMRKASANVWIGTKRQNASSVSITLRTDRKDNFISKTIETNLSSFRNLDFGSFSFDTNYRPHITKLKLKAKKFVYYKLVLFSNKPDKHVTVTAADVRVRFVGYAK